MERGHAVTKSRVLVKVVPSRGSAGHREVNPEGRQLGGEPDPRRGESAAREVSIDLTGDVALEYPDDVPLGPSFLHPAVEIGGGLGVMGDADHGDAPQRCVGLTIAAVVSTKVTGSLSRTGRDRGGPAQMGPGGFRVEPFVRGHPVSAGNRPALKDLIKPSCAPVLLLVVITTICRSNEPILFRERVGNDGC